MSKEGDGDGAGVEVGEARESDRKDDWRGGDCCLVDEECLFLVKSLETEAVAWEVLASGNVGGAKSRGGRRVLGLVTGFDTVKNSQYPRVHEK